MEQIFSVEEVRGKLGQVMKEITAGSDPVLITRRGSKPCVLVSRDEYAHLRALENRVRADGILDRMEKTRKAIADAGLDESILDDLEAAVRDGEP